MNIKTIEIYTRAARGVRTKLADFAGGLYCFKEIQLSGALKELWLAQQKECDFLLYG